MKAMSQRQARVAEQVRMEIGRLITRADFIDPEVSALLSIPHVWISPDLRNARVFFALANETFAPKEVAKFLNDQGFRFQKELAKLPTKFTPKVKFILDEQSDKTARIEEILAKDKYDAS